MRGERIVNAKTTIDKQTRAMKVTPLIERGCVSVPTCAPWLDTLRREFIGFPANKNDDQVDSIVLFLERSQAMIGITNHIGRVRTGAPRIEAYSGPVLTVRGIGPGRLKPFSQFDHAVREHFRGW
jgi:hypothetical protein